MPTDSSQHLEDDGYCFVCGAHNTDGLRLNWEVRGNETLAEFLPERKHQGWKNMVHGGLLAALLDEAMTRLIWKKLGAAVTAEMTVRYLAPAAIGEKLLVHGEILDNAKRLVRARADITRPDGTVVAKSEGKALKLTGPIELGRTTK